MVHPVETILRIEPKGYTPNAQEVVVYYDQDKKKMLDKLPSFFGSLLPRNIVSYVINIRETARGALSVSWKNNNNQELKLNINYVLRIQPADSKNVIIALQRGATPADTFEKLILEFCDQFYESKYEEGIDAIDQFFSVDQEKGKTIKQELEDYLSTEIKVLIGFKVRNISVSVITERRELEDFTIKRLAKHEAIEVKLKGYTDTLRANYEILLKPTQGQSRIYAILRHTEMHKFRSIIEAQIKNFLLEKVSLTEIYDHPNRVNEKLKIILDQRFSIYGRKASFFNLMIAREQGVIIETIPFTSVSTRVLPKGSTKQVDIMTDVSARITNYARYKESKVDDAQVFIESSIHDIVQKEVINLITYQELLVDDSRDKRYEKDIASKLEIKLARVGIEIISATSILSEQIEFPTEENLHCKIYCKVKGSDHPIIFENTIKVQVYDKSKYIRNFPLQQYRERGFKSWFDEQMDIVVKGVIEFKDYRTICIESAQLRSIELNSDIIEEELDNTNYKSKITKLLGERLEKIGCNFQNLVIEPELNPLRWLEPNNISFIEEFKTKNNGIPVKFRLELTYFVRELSLLDPSLIKPEVNLADRVISIAKEVISNIMLGMPSEYVYKGYETPLIEDISPREHLQSALSNALKNKINAITEFIDISPESTPFLESFNKLRKIDGEVELKVYNEYSHIETTILITYQVASISNWTLYTEKMEDDPYLMIERINKGIEVSVRKKMKFLDAEDARLRDADTLNVLEQNLNNYLNGEISKRFGLEIYIHDVDKKGSIIDDLARKNRIKSISNQAKLDEELNTLLLGEKQSEMRELFNEKEMLENRKKEDLASEGDLKRLKEINKKIQKFGEKENLGYSSKNRSKRLKGNSSSRLFSGSKSNEDPKKIEDNE